MIAHALCFYRSPALNAIMIIAVSSILLALALTLVLHGHDNTTIGGTEVPAIHCAEDEVISWIGIDTLGCVHFENIN